MPGLSPEAFAARLRPLQKTLTSYAQTALRQFTRDTASQADIEDAVSTTTLHALKGLATYDDSFGDTGLRKWLFKILRRVCWKIAQKTHALRTLAEGTEEPTPGLESVVLARMDAVSRIKAAKLTELQTRCLQATLRGEAAERAAQRLGISVKAFYCHVSRAKAKLREVRDV